MGIREEYSITKQHDLERLPVDFPIDGRTLPFPAPNVRKSNAWMAKVAASEARFAIAEMIASVHEAFKLSESGDPKKSEELVSKVAFCMQPHMGQIMDLAYDLAEWDEETRAFFDDHADESDVLRLFVTAYLLGNRLRAQAAMIAAAASEYPKDSAASESNAGQTNSKKPLQTSTSSCSKSARRSTRGQSKSATPPA